jgi:hypothetical protein
MSLDARAAALNPSGSGAAARAGITAAIDSAPAITAHIAINTRIMLLLLTCPLFDELVGTGEQRRSHVERSFVWRANRQA